MNNKAARLHGAQLYPTNLARGKSFRVVWGTQFIIREFP
jgi:hypothetical protein